MRRRLESIVLLILSISLAAAAPPNESPENRAQSNQPVSEHRITFQSLPENFDYNGVRSILEDHKGYLWFGTEDGLIRFDGIHLFLYEHSDDDSSSVIHNEVNTIAEDSKGNLWIGTSKGLNLYNRELDNFIDIGRVAPQLWRLSDNYISDLFIDDESQLWIATFGDGFHIFNTGNNTLQHFSHDPQNPEKSIRSNVTRIAIRKEKVWLGTQNGLCLFDRKDTSFRYFRNANPNSANPGNNYVVSLSFDSMDELWIGTREGGINRLSEQSGEYTFPRYTHGNIPENLSDNVVLSIAEDANGNIWFGTENGGLVLFKKNEKIFDVFRVEEGNNQSLNSNSIWSLCTDREGRIWIGTANKGVNVFDRKYNKFESYQKNYVSPQSSLSHNDVRSFAEDEKGIIWIGTDGGGISCFDPASHKFIRQINNKGNEKLLENNAVQSIVIDAKQKLWVGLWAGGIDRLNSEGVRIKNYTPVTEDGQAIRYIRSLYADSRNNVWAGSAGYGLFKYNDKQDRFEPANCPNSFGTLNSSSFITSILEDSEGYYWIGTLNGLVLATYKEGILVNCEDALPDVNPDYFNRQMIHVIFQDSKGRIWVGTSDYGLSLIDMKKRIIRPFKKKDGLLSNTIFGILEDDEGYLWITTNRGISRFHYDSISFTNFTREDGLNSNEFYTNSCIRTSSGQFFVGNENGFNVFYPGRILKNEVIPAVHLSDLKIDNIHCMVGGKASPLNKHIAETDEIKLTHKQSSFSIEFVALNYTRPKKNQFMYKLAGLDMDWIEAGNDHTASYTNIKPGNYEFLVKGSNNDGVWNHEPRRLQITVLPPFWKTWWAYLFYFVIIVSLSVLVFRIWQERTKIKHQLLLEKMAKEKEHEMNERNIEFFTNISHEFRTPLSLIIGPLENLINSTQIGIKDQLRIIQRNANRLLHLTNNLMNFRKFEEDGVKLNVQKGDILTCLKDISNYFSIRIRRRKLKLNIESNESEIIGWFDAEKLETILLNLLSNAIKFTSDGGLLKIEINSHDTASAIRKFGENIVQDLAGFRHLEVKVIDQGRGISSEDLPYIFDKFYQAKNADIKRQTGTGIGLSLTRGLTEIHHGHIWVQSVPDVETSFTVLIPIDRGAYADYEVRVQPENEIEKNIVKADFGSTPIESAEVLSDDDSGEKPEILIIEDNDELRLFLVRELGKEYNVKQAEDGELGLDMAFNLVPDLIITDVLMPRLSGFELCKTVKSDIRTSHIPLILLTAKTTIRDQIEGVEMGADVYITKPFNIKLLQKQIYHLIQSRRILYAQFSQDAYLMPNKLSANQMDQEFLQKSIDYILQNISDEKLNVEGLAEVLKLNRSNVYRKIKALTGSTVVEFIRNLRLKQAIKLMEINKYSLAEIAYQTGFTSPSYFTKMFKRSYGKTPSEYISSN